MREGILGACRLVWRMLADGEPPDGRFLGWCALLAFFAGGARAIVHRTPKTTWVSVVAAALASSIAGLLVGSLCLWAKVNVYLSFPLVGTAGWIGIWLMDSAGEWAKQVVRAKFNAKESDSP